MSKPRTISDYPNRADDYESAAEKAHDQNTDIALDEGGDHEVTAEDIVGHIENEENPHGTTAGQVGAYTKSETDDLLDDKFDKSGGTIEGVTIIETDSANGLEIIRTGSNGGRTRLRILNASNSGMSPEFVITGDGTSDTPGLPLYVPGRISTRDGFYIGSTRKDLEWDAKADLEGGNDFSGDQAVMRTRVKHQISKHIGTAPGNNECIILFGPSSETIHIAGTILAINDVENTQRDQFRIDLTASTGSSRYNVSLQKNTGWHPDIRIVTCEYNGEVHSGLLIGGAFGTFYPNRYYFAGLVVGDESYPLTLPATSVTNIESETAANEAQNIFLSDTTIYTGTVTADDFITTSRVESDNENALSALDNMAEWKKKDGTIDYKKHYAYTPQVVRDEKGKVIEEKPGLSMEKRVAMLEKMVAELSDQLQNEKTQRK